MNRHSVIVRKAFLEAADIVLDFVELLVPIAWSLCEYYDVNKLIPASADAVVCIVNE